MVRVISPQNPSLTRPRNNLFEFVAFRGRRFSLLKRAFFHPAALRSRGTGHSLALRAERPLSPLRSLWQSAAMTQPPVPLTPEWARQCALWVGWPRLAAEWSGLIEPARDEIAAFVRTVAKFQPVRLAIGDAQAEAAARARGLHEIATFVNAPTGDIWLRDTGPLFSAAQGVLRAVVPRFNGWGGKYAMEGDEETGAALAAFEAADIRCADIVLEGGAIDTDGSALLTTRECLLNPNRNGFSDQASAERALRDLFAVDRIVWITEGLLNDHTDGHIDNAARFVAPGHVVCQFPFGTDDPHTNRLHQIRAELKEAGLKVSTIPGPGRVDDDLPASHLNFTVINGAVIMPTYGTPSATEALEGLGALFPGREIIGLPANAILSGGGGSFHCMTREVPAAETEAE